MNEKRIISAVLALMTVLACLVGCGQKQTDGPAEEGDLLARIQARGSIIVAMEGTWAPWTYHDENDNLVGYDVEVATLIAEKLGVEPEFIEGEWDGLLAGLVRRYVLEKSTLPRTALAFFPAALLGSVLWQSMALALVYGGEAKEAFFLAKLVSRGVQFALTASVDTLIVWLLLRRGALSGVQRHIQAKGGRKHDDP